MTKDIEPLKPLKIEIGRWYELIHYKHDPERPDSIGEELYATLVKPLTAEHVKNLQEAVESGGVRAARGLYEPPERIR